MGSARANRKDLEEETAVRTGEASLTGRDETFPRTAEPLGNTPTLGETVHY